jgi:hypothetical protein
VGALGRRALGPDHAADRSIWSGNAAASDPRNCLAELSWRLCLTTTVDLFQNVRSAAPLIVAGGATLWCGLIGLLIFLALVLARRPGDGRGLRLLGAAAALLAAAGFALTGAGAAMLAPAAGPGFDKAALWFLQQSRMARDIPRSLTAEEIRALFDSPKHREPKDLSRHEFQVCSQNGEDGLIAEIFKRVGTSNRYFVEFGASDGFENNSTLLVGRAGASSGSTATTAPSSAPARTSAPRSRPRS